MDNKGINGYINNNRLKDKKIRINSQDNVSTSNGFSKSPDSFSLSRYGRARRLKLTDDFYCSDEALSPMLNTEGATTQKFFKKADRNKRNKSYIEGTNRLLIDEEDTLKSNSDSEFDNLLKIISRPSQSDQQSPTSPSFKISTLKTYSNRKKRFSESSNKSFTDEVVSELDSFSWTENVLTIEEKIENTSLEPVKSSVDISAVNNVVKNIILEFESLSDTCPNEDPVSSTETIAAYQDFENTITQSINCSEESNILIKKEVQSPVIDSSTPIKQCVEESENNSDQDLWSVGELIWTRLGNHPLWPSMIDLDPLLNTFVKFRAFGKNSIPHKCFHVKFFGDRGRRSWVPASTALKFYGKSHFDKLAHSITSEVRKKNPKYASGFVIGPNNYSKWMEAVLEAESLLNKTVEERLNFFSQISPKKIRTSFSKEKRRESSGINISADSVINEKSEETSKEKFVETTSKEKSNNVLVQKKLKTKKSKFKKAKLTKLENVYPSRSRKQVDRYTDLQFTLNNQEIKIISKIAKSKIKVENEDATREFSTPSPSASTLTLPSSDVKQKKKHISKGSSKKRVCDVCVKPKNVFKCRGNCVRYFHYECAKNPDKHLNPIYNLHKIQVQNTSNVSINNEETSNFVISKTVDLSIAEKIDAKMAEVMKELGDKIKYSEVSTDESMNIDNSVEQFCVTSTPLKTGGESEIVAENESVNEFKCVDCIENRLPTCFVCDSYTNVDNSDDRKKCSLPQCGRSYHPNCLKGWPQTQWRQGQKETETLICPYHVCHTCVSDDPRASRGSVFSNNDRLIKCIRCPTAYHSSNYCIPAGSEMLSYCQMVCPKHITLKQKRKSSHHVNANWCFICSIGGSLICCETCPTSFHAECLKISPPEGSYICEECETGRLPLYDEIVWVKLGQFRWWPAQILYPSEIPENIVHLPHNVGEFVVKFFGSHDYYWINRGRVFLYQDGDTGKISTIKKKVDGLFLKALEEAAVAFKILQDERVNRAAETKSFLKPPPYIRIKTNKPVGNVRVGESHTNSLTPCECDPNAPEPCGPDSQCLNRLLLTECNPSICPAGEKCNNQQFEKRQYPRLEPYRTSGRGWGLKTLEPIKKHQFVIEYVGEMIDELEYRKRVKRMSEQKDENYYFLTIDKDRMLDAGPKGNVARFMNHSCQPNCETQKWTVNGNTRVGLFSLEDIGPDTELTFNYNLECIGTEKKICRCGAPHCSGFIGVKVKQRKVEKTKRIKKYKSSKIGYKIKTKSKSTCFVCGKPDSEGKCRNSKCLKKYHLACVNLTEWPKENWWCPRHKCFLCERIYKLKFCINCTRSFCPQHMDEKFLVLNSKEVNCTLHSNEMLEKVEPVLLTSQIKVKKQSNMNLQKIKRLKHPGKKVSPTNLCKKITVKKMKGKLKLISLNKKSKNIKKFNKHLTVKQKKLRLPLNKTSKNSVNTLSANETNTVVSQSITADNVLNETASSTEMQLNEQTKNVHVNETATCTQEKENKLIKQSVLSFKPISKNSKQKGRKILNKLTVFRRASDNISHLVNKKSISIDIKLSKSVRRASDSVLIRSSKKTNKMLKDSNNDNSEDNSNELLSNKLLILDDGLRNKESDNNSEENNQTSKKTNHESEKKKKKNKHSNNDNNKFIRSNKKSNKIHKDNNNDNSKDIGSELLSDKLLILEDGLQNKESDNNSEENNQTSKKTNHESEKKNKKNKHSNNDNNKFIRSNKKSNKMHKDNNNDNSKDIGSELLSDKLLILEDGLQNKESDNNSEENNQTSKKTNYESEKKNKKNKDSNNDNSIFIRSNKKSNKMLEDSNNDNSEESGSELLSDKLLILDDRLQNKESENNSEENNQTSKKTNHESEKKNKTNKDSNNDNSIFIRNNKKSNKMLKDSNNDNSEDNGGELLPDKLILDDELQNKESDDNSEDNNQTSKKTNHELEKKNKKNKDSNTDNSTFIQNNKKSNKMLKGSNNDNSEDNSGELLPDKLILDDGLQNKESDNNSKESKQTSKKANDESEKKNKKNKLRSSNNRLQNKANNNSKQNNKIKIKNGLKRNIKKILPLLKNDLRNKSSDSNSETNIKKINNGLTEKVSEISSLNNQTESEQSTTMNTESERSTWNIEKKVNYMLKDNYKKIKPPLNDNLKKEFDLEQHTKISKIINNECDNKNQALSSDEVQNESDNISETSNKKQINLLSNDELQNDCLSDNSGPSIKTIKEINNELKENKSDSNSEPSNESPKVINNELKTNNMKLSSSKDQPYESDNPENSTKKFEKTDNQLKENCKEIIPTLLSNELQHEFDSTKTYKNNEPKENDNKLSFENQQLQNVSDDNLERNNKTNESNKITSSTNNQVQNQFDDILKEDKIVHEVVKRKRNRKNTKKRKLLTDDDNSETFNEGLYLSKNEKQDKISENIFEQNDKVLKKSNEQADNNIKNISEISLQKSKNLINKKKLKLLRRNSEENGNKNESENKILNKKTENLHKKNENHFKLNHINNNKLVIILQDCEKLATKIYEEPQKMLQSNSVRDNSSTESIPQTSKSHQIVDEISMNENSYLVANKKESNKRRVGRPRKNKKTTDDEYVPCNPLDSQQIKRENIPNKRKADNNEDSNHSIRKRQKLVNENIPKRVLRNSSKFCSDSTKKENGVTVSTAEEADSNCQKQKRIHNLLFDTIPFDSS